MDIRNLLWLYNFYLGIGISEPSAGHQTKCQQSDESLLYTPDEALIWTNIAEQKGVRQVWNYFPYYILKIPQNKCAGNINIEIQICYSISNDMNQNNAVIFTWYNKSEDGQLLLKKSTTQYIVKEPDRNCFRHNGSYVCCPRFLANDEQFQRDVSDYIGIYGTLNNDDFKLWMLTPKRFMETCTIQIHKWKMISNENVNISGDCNETNAMQFNPLVFRIWIYANASNKKLKFGLSISGGIISFVSIIGIVIALMCCVSFYYKKKLVLLSREYITLMEERSTIIKPGKIVNETDFNVEYKRMDSEFVHNKEQQEETHLDDSNYVIPPFEEEALYCVLEKNMEYILRTSVKCHAIIGSGQFGNVYKGAWLYNNREIDVAVKTLKDGCKDEDRVKFLQEAAIMGQFKDPNVVTLYGVVTAGEPIMLVLELLSNGDLLSHLKNSLLDEDGSKHLDPHTFLSYSRQIVSGMVHLSSKHFVHRDLAARNILLSGQGICKVADFGMARDLLYENFSTSRGEMIPVKWTAPEAVHYKQYSTASDVWSFGVVMYEIWSGGQKPFSEISNSKVVGMIDSGYRLPPPPGCPRKIYSLMMDCWHSEPARRPVFVELKDDLSLPDSMLLKLEEDER